MLEMLSSSTSIAIATSLLFLFLSLSSNPKTHFHTLFLSPSLSSNSSIADHLTTLTRRPHLAASAANAAAARHVLAAFAAAGIPSRLAAYEVALTRPISRTLTLTLTPSDPPTRLSLTQQNLAGNPYANDAVPTFHAYAKSGAAVGPVVYARYGRVEDFAALTEMKVNVTGSVVLARYGEIYRGDIVRNAEVAGAAGVVVYTAAEDYGGEKWFPEERFMPPSGVQVGTVYGGVGDPTTPGWASVAGCERVGWDDVERGGEVPGIPSLPVSAEDGEVLMKGVGGHVAVEWKERGGGGGVRVGPGPGIVNLTYVVGSFFFLYLITVFILGI